MPILPILCVCEKPEWLAHWSPTEEILELNSFEWNYFVIKFNEFVNNFVEKLDSANINHDSCHVRKKPSMLPIVVRNVEIMGILLFLQFHYNKAVVQIFHHRHIFRRPKPLAEPFLPSAT